MTAEHPNQGHGAEPSFARIEAAGPRDACPDANEVAGYVHAALSDREQEAVERHLVACRSCRDLVLALRGGRMDRPLRVTIVWTSVAVALAAGLIALVWWLASPERSAPLSVDERLRITALELARIEPALFGGFELLGCEERRTNPGATLRGDCTILTPSGTILEGRPSFRWWSTLPAERWRVSLHTAAGAPLWSARAVETELAFPREAADLTAGGFLVEIRGEGGPRELLARRVFEVAEDEDRDLWKRAQVAIDTHAGEPLGALLKAHWALRRDLFDEAERWARFAATGGERVALETLYQVLLRKRDPEAESIARRIADQDS